MIGISLGESCLVALRFGGRKEEDSFRSEEGVAGVAGLAAAEDGEARADDSRDGKGLWGIWCLALSTEGRGAGFFSV
tara:strand:- start:1306 stop:1536 length:231 start_codon:yes stop_codon:yes gene_type:complete